MDFQKLFLLALQLLFVQCQTNFYRLPENVRPVDYILTIESNFDAMTFNGSVSIIFNVITSMDSFSLHSKDLTIESVQLSLHGLNQELNDYNLTTGADLLNIYPKQPILGIGYQLNINFKGTIGDGNVGFYRAFYAEANKVVTMAVTHLEATNARRAFPCFDQPNFKAQFQINLVRKSYQITSSNMRLLNSIPLGYYDKVIDVYETSLTMSTYLIAYMVSEYASMSIIEDRKTYTTYARPELLKRGDAIYSLQVAPEGIRRMESFTGIEYPISKMDQVPVPNNYYKIGAMENWGMVTFRERMLMYNSELSTAQEKQSVATIIIHEFAHQWFGDLVTPEWWNYIWLNEGFATYFEQYITSLIETSWNLMEQFITANVQPAFNDDAYESSRPMSRDVETPADIEGIYDTIVYEKAGSVIRMTENFLGATVFQTGLQNYLKTWSYDNANPTKLYQSWQEALNNPNLNVTAILHGWETQAGYPVVTATRSYGSNSNSVGLKQERFYINRATGSDTTRWMIPLDYITEKSQTGTITWFNAATSTININLGAKDWVVFNKNRKGFYRVNYDETNWELITKFLQRGDFDVITVENRAQLIDDAFNLARAGRLNYTIAMELATYVTNETHYVPIATFNSVLSYLDRMSTGLDHHVDLKEYALNILGPIYKKYGFNISYSDGHLEKLTKVNINTWLCNYGHKKCLEESGKLLVSWLNNTIVQPDMQSYVYCYGMKRLNQTQHTSAIAKYSSSSEDTEKARIATGLGCAGNTTILRSFLQNLIADDTFTQTDKLNAFTSVYTNNGNSGVDLMLEFLTADFVKINQRFENVARIISGVASRITTSGQVDKFNAFANQHSGSMTQTLKNTVATANATAHNNLEWINENKRDIILYLNGGPTVPGSMFLMIICVQTIYLFN